MSKKYILSNYHIKIFDESRRMEIVKKEELKEVEEKDLFKLDLIDEDDLIIDDSFLGDEKEQIEKYINLVGDYNMKFLENTNKSITYTENFVFAIEKDRCKLIAEVYEMDEL